MIYHGDALDVLKTLEDESVDVLVTDPPYGIGFMGKEWDTFRPDFVANGVKKSSRKDSFLNPKRSADARAGASPAMEAARYDHSPAGARAFREWLYQHSLEWLRVMKPGAFAFVCIGARQDSVASAITAMTEAGFKTDFTSLFWTYASGFPKAMNIGKMVDKRNGRNADERREYGRWLNSGREEVFVSRAQVATMLSFTFDYKNLQSAMAHISNWELGKELPTYAKHMKLKELLSLDDSYDQLIEREEAEREVIRQRKVPAGHAFAGEVYDTANGDKDFNDTVAATDAAKALDGSYGGFQPKPAVEVIIVAMKPLSEKTYVDQALKNGKGITWLDSVRIPTNGETPSGSGKLKALRNTEGRTDEQDWYATSTDNRGRFPANLLVSDDVLNDGIDRKSGTVKPYKENHTNVSSYGFNRDKTYESAANSGSYSRFFSLDGWAQTLPFLAVPKASKSEKSPPGLKNIHPTCKPLKLMSYLITLGSRPGDTVLDPFLGSGTTAIAAKQLGRNYIGIEREQEYVDIAEARLAAVQPTLLTQQTVENKV